MNSLKTSRRFEAVAENSSGKTKLLKCENIFEENPLEILVKEGSFRKDTCSQPAILPKNELHYKFLSTDFLERPH